MSYDDQDDEIRGDPATIARLSAEVERLRRVLDEIVSDGDMTFRHALYLARAALAPQQQADATGGEGWVSVSDRLPAKLTPVLVAVDLDDGGDPIVRAAFMDLHDWREQSATRDDGPDGDIVGRVYAWRPMLPPPPASGTGEKL